MQANDLAYSITPACLTTHECRYVLEALSAGGVIRSRAGARHLMANPVVAGNTDLLIRLASEWLNGMAIPFRATLFEKSHTTNWLVPWHEDTVLPLARRFRA